MVKVIAEIGINHQGNVDIAIQLASVAYHNGASYVKLQKREIEWCYSPEQLAAPCKSPWGDTILDKVSGRELSWEDFDKFDAACKEIGIGWSSSCFDLWSLAKLNERYQHLPFNKVPSAMGIRPKYLRAVASWNRLAIISTGLMTDAQIDEAADIFDEARCPYIFFHTTAIYPCPQERLNLKVIPEMIKKYTRRPHCVGIGYSGHETGVLPSVIAAHLGATWIERHVTLDRTWKGSDHAASLEPTGLYRVVRDIGALEKILGSGERRLRGDEKNPVTFWRDR